MLSYISHLQVLQHIGRKMLQFAVYYCEDTYTWRQNLLVVSTFLSSFPMTVTSHSASLQSSVLTHNCFVGEAQWPTEEYYCRTSQFLWGVTLEKKKLKCWELHEDKKIWCRFLPIWCNFFFTSLCKSGLDCQAFFWSLFFTDTKHEACITAPLLWFLVFLQL